MVQDRCPCGRVRRFPAHQCRRIGSVWSISAATGLAAQSKRDGHARRHGQFGIRNGANENHLPDQAGHSKGDEPLGAGRQGHRLGAAAEEAQGRSGLLHSAAIIQGLIPVSRSSRAPHAWRRGTRTGRRGRYARLGRSSGRTKDCGQVSEARRCARTARSRRAPRR